VAERCRSHDTLVLPGNLVIIGGFANERVREPIRRDG
jgi:hypothetical protein